MTLKFKTFDFTATTEEELRCIKQQYENLQGSYRSSVDILQSRLFDITDILHSQKLETEAQKIFPAKSIQQQQQQQHGDSKDVTLERIQNGVVDCSEASPMAKKSSNKNRRKRQDEEEITDAVQRRSETTVISDNSRLGSERNSNNPPEEGDHHNSKSQQQQQQQQQHGQKRPKKSKSKKKQKLSRS